MASQTLSFNDDYTCTVSGEYYQYDVQYTPGSKTVWNANIYHDGDLKGAPSGEIIDNALVGEGLRQYLIAYVEGIIERGLGIEE